jgi:hypothetical protein
MPETLYQTHVHQVSLDALIKYYREGLETKFQGKIISEETLVDPVKGKVVFIFATSQEKK